MTQTNHQDVEKVLLQQENLQLTLHLLADGGFKLSDPGITEVIQELCTSCPTMFKCLLHSVEDATLDETNLGTDIIKSHTHQSPLTFSWLVQAYVQDTLNLPVHLAKMDVWDHFATMLCKVYNEEYNMPNVSGLGNIIMAYYEKISFLPPNSYCQYSLKVGNFICFRGDQKGQIENIFIHSIMCDNRRAFL